MALILVADDNAEHSSYIEIALSREGHQVSVSPNGSVCLKQIEEWGDQNVDLVITDIFMPVCDGFELTTEIRKKYSWIPVVGMTGRYVDTPYDYGDSLIKLGAVTVLRKPIPLDELVKTVEDYLPSDTVRAS